MGWKSSFVLLKTLLTMLLVHDMTFPTTRPNYLTYTLKKHHIAVFFRGRKSYPKLSSLSQKGTTCLMLEIYDPVWRIQNPTRTMDAGRRGGGKNRRDTYQHGVGSAMRISNREPEICTPTTAWTVPMKLVSRTQSQDRSNSF